MPGPGCNSNASTRLLPGAAEHVGTLTSLRLLRAVLSDRVFADRDLCDRGGTFPVKYFVERYTSPMHHPSSKKGVQQMHFDVETFAGRGVDGVSDGSASRSSVPFTTCNCGHT